MESRWLLLGFGLLFGLLLLVNIQQGNPVLALAAVVFMIFGLGGFWWNTTKENPSKQDFRGPVNVLRLVPVLALPWV